MSSPPITPRPRGRPRGRPPGSKSKIPRAPPSARGRPRRTRHGDDEEDVIKAEDVALEDDELADDRRLKRRRRTTTGGDETGDEDQEEEGEVREDPRVAAARKARAARMRNMAARNAGGGHTVAPLDLDGNPQEIADDEVVVPKDPVGETKVDENGILAGGREYRCRTFTVLGKGDRLYMLSTEPARCIGFRDSYLFFQRHRQLLKVIVDDRQKFDLIEREIIPHSYKGRAIGVVTARSVFREFGARIVVGGRRIVDDYSEEKARAEGAVDGQLADPDDKLPPPGVEYNRNQYVAWHGASAVYHTQQATLQPEIGGVGPFRDQKKKSVVITDENWMLEHARAASSFNSLLAQQRRKLWADKGVYEPHTGIVMVPAASQPTKVTFEYVA
ncbi:chromatin remodelling complex Rsc7/Swp82 subunit-domain-containing protein [Lipomyces orientalis]|uniref:Chromatin remodelling complex Rsc7/Swp82 subunit-domain-containing protein n=1 Tax=Lipomyces orientalis TaxID=1233043 RepID=A0ACC3TJ67_9ASCO